MGLLLLFLCFCWLRAAVLSFGLDAADVSVTLLLSVSLMLALLMLLCRAAVDWFAMIIAVFFFWLRAAVVRFGLDVACASVS